jgi:hypothetical protein
MNRTFVVAVDGSLSVSEQETRPSGRESRIPNILERLKDPNFSAHEVTRLVTEEIALLVQEMREDAYDSTLAFKLKSCSTQIKALRALEKVLEKSERNRDVLNFDGRQFVFAVGRIVDVFMEATQTALGKNYESCSGSIWKHLRDEIGMKEEEIRRETAKIQANDPRAQGRWVERIGSV